MLLLTNARLIDGSGVAAIENGSVLIDGSRIVSTAAGDPSVANLPNIERIDLRGATLLPGLIDCHVHITWQVDSKTWTHPDIGNVEQLRANAIDHAKATISAGFTTVQDLMGVNDAVFAARDKIAFGQTLGARIVSSGACITITDGHGMQCGPGHAIEANSATDVLAAVRRQVDAGADAIKVMVGRAAASPEFFESPAYSVDDLRPGVNAAHRAGLHVCAHAHTLPTAIWTAVEAGIDSIEHGAPIDDITLRKMAERGTFLVPTLSVGLGLPELEEESDLPFSPEVIEWMRRLDRQTKETVRRAHDAGVSIALGTDAGCPSVRHGTNASELELLVSCGLSPMEAIVAGTRNAAINIGRSHELGLIAPGQLADLVVVDGDPLGDIRLLREAARILMVMKKGEVVIDRRHNLQDDRAS